MNIKRLVLYLLLNAAVSAAVTYGVLWWWERTHPTPAGLAAVPTLPATATAGASLIPVGAATEPAGEAPTAESGPAEPASEPTPTLYIVKAGDTLGRIAQQYDVPVEDIMAANGLTDPNVLSVGQSLIIPVGGLAPTEPPPPPPATPTAEPPRPTATRDPNVAAPRLVIREVVAGGDLNDELLVIVNEGGPVDLAGWSLRDATGRQYVFPALMLFEDGAINLHTAAGADTVTDLFWGLAEPVWSPGATALLSDAAGNLHARLEVP